MAMLVSVGHDTNTGMSSVTGGPPVPPNAAATTVKDPALSASSFPSEYCTDPRGPLTRMGALGIAFPCASYAVTLKGTDSPAFMVTRAGSATSFATAVGSCA